MTYFTPSSPSSSSSSLSRPIPSPFFILGDSHSVTLHSQLLNLLLPHRQELHWYQLRSYLIVGLKAWHIGEIGRSNSLQLLDRSHPSSILQHYARLIPPFGSRVMIIAGEIDCRSEEGIMAAVARGKYSSIREGIHDTVKHFLDGLTNLARQYPNWNGIYIHPVSPPFLRGHKIKVAQTRRGVSRAIDQNENSLRPIVSGMSDGTFSSSSPIASSLVRVHTRALLIRDYNAELRRQMLKLVDPTSSSLSSQCRIHLLDFYSHLCTHLPDESTFTEPPLLRSDFTLEGMHLNTRYVPYIEKELEGIIDIEHR